MTTQTYSAAYDITSQHICDQIITAIEGGINYWCAGAILVRPDKSTLAETPWYSDPKLYEQDFLIKVALHEPHEDDKIDYELTPDAIRKGLAVLAEKYKWRINEIVTEDGDAETGDVFLQCCLFGEIVYG